MNFLNNVHLLEHNSLLSFMISADLCIDEGQRFHLWDHLKPALLNHRLPQLEEGLKEINGIWFPQLKCKFCSANLRWIEMNESRDDEDLNFFQALTFARFDCAECYRCGPILKCEIEQTIKIFTEILTLENSQIIATSLYLIMKSGYWLNYISPPPIEIVDDPFIILKSILTNQPNELKYGGGNKSILLVDIFENDDYLEYPIFYICDTATIPSRFYFIPLKFKSEEFNPKPNLINASTIYNKNVKIPKYQEKYLVKELSEIGNNCIKIGSDVILGQRLQNYISEKHYKFNKNINIAVPSMDYSIVDDVIKNFENVIEPAENICNLCLKVAFSNDKYNIRKVSFKKRYHILNLHLISAVWLLMFNNSIFVSLLFHIMHIDEEENNNNHYNF